MSTVRLELIEDVKCHRKRQRKTAEDYRTETGQSSGRNENNSIHYLPLLTLPPTVSLSNEPQEPIRWHRRRLNGKTVQMPPFVIGQYTNLCVRPSYHHPSIPLIPQLIKRPDFNFPSQISYTHPTATRRLHPHYIHQKCPSFTSIFPRQLLPSPRPHPRLFSMRPSMIPICFTSALLDVVASVGRMRVAFQRR